NKRVYETTKEKIELFTRQWTELFCNIAFKIFKDMKIETTMSSIKKEFDKYVNFKIVSNVLQEQNNDWKKTMEVFKGGIISKETALKLIYPDMNTEEIDSEKEKIEESDEQKKQINEQFPNENPFGSENDKNNNDLSEKEPRGNDE
ncbi:MAG: hypothetical protein ACRCRQ_01360, partial [Metamycoplasmataceae bacterium]